MSTVVRPASAPPEDLRATHRGFTRSLTREHGYEPLRVEGAIPEGLRGTLLRNGPGLYELFGRPYGHPFEGDGAILGVRLGPRGASGAHRVIESRGLMEERRRGRPLYGTNAPQLSRTWRGIRRRMKNPANTNVMRWQGRLLALWEAGLPTELDPESLATLGETDLGGVVASAFSAHPHRVEARRTTYNFGQRIEARGAWLDLYALPDVGPASRLASVRLRRPVMLHDFIATSTHAIFFVAPVQLRIWRGLLGIGDFRDYFRWAPEDGTEVIVVPLDRPHEVVRFDVEPFWVWHFANAFDRGPEIVIDWVRYDDLRSLDALERPGVPVEQGRLVRSVLDPRAGRLSAPEPRWDRPCEFPVIDPRRAGAEAREVWVASDDARCRVARVDVARGEARAWDAPVGHRPSEPVLVPDARPDGGAGWALSVVYDASADESYVAVLDGARPDAGPLARVWLGHHAPPTFHGVFVPS